MTNVLPQDTPFHRASIKEMTSDQLEALVTSMQERRMRQYTLFEAAQAAKAKIKEEKDKARYDKLLEMLGKKLESTQKSLDASTKYLNELKVLELVLGDR